MSGLPTVSTAPRSVEPRRFSPRPPRPGSRWPSTRAGRALVAPLPFFSTRGARSPAQAVATSRSSASARDQQRALIETKLSQAADGGAAGRGNRIVLPAEDAHL